MYLDVVLLGLAVGRLLGGRLINLGSLPLRGLAGFLLLGAVEAAMQASQAPERRLLYQTLIMASGGILAWLLWINRRLPGVWLVILGLGLNLAVMAANGGRMPVSEWAALASGQGDYLPELVSGTGARHMLLTALTHLPLLADIIPLPSPYPVPRVLSIGDVVLFAGLIRLLVAGMLTTADQKTQCA